MKYLGVHKTSDTENTLTKIVTETPPVEVTFATYVTIVSSYLQIWLAKSVEKPKYESNNNYTRTKLQKINKFQNNGQRKAVHHRQIFHMKIQNALQNKGRALSVMKIS